MIKYTVEINDLSGQGKRKMMFIIELTYIKPIEAVESALEAHIAFLNRYYDLGVFVCSGRKNPRTGGIIICNVEGQEALQSVISEDPFYQNEIAEYKVIEFVPTMYAEGFDKFIKG